MKQERLSTPDYWAAIYEKAAQTGRDPLRPNRFKKWVPERLRLLRKRLLQCHWSRQLVEVLLRPHLEGRSGLKGLEIGSAPGWRSLGLWLRFGIMPYGLEYTEAGTKVQRALYRSRGLPEELVIHGDFFDDALRARWAGTFDLVASYGFIEHFSDPKDVVSKHLELLRPGGLLAVIVPNLNDSAWYGRLVRRFNPAVHAICNIQICSREALAGLVSATECDTIFCDTIGGPDIGFDPDRRWSSRSLSRFFRFINPLANILNHLCIGKRLVSFPRTASTVALVAVKKQPGAVRRGTNSEGNGR
jgi:SAM-dependent methyltransferase